MTITWTPVVKKIKDLKEYAKNPRVLHKKDEQHIRESIEKFGMADPVILNLDDTIIGGHQRIRTLRKLKISTTQAMVPDRMLDDKEVEELCIRLNRNHGAFDFDMLANSFDAAELLQWGFSTEELVGDLEDITQVDSVEEEKEKTEKVCPHCGEKL